MCFACSEFCFYNMIWRFVQVFQQFEKYISIIIFHRIQASIDTKIASWKDTIMQHQENPKFVHMQIRLICNGMVQFIPRYRMISPFSPFVIFAYIPLWILCHLECFEGWQAPWFVVVKILSVIGEKCSLYSLILSFMHRM